MLFWYNDGIQIIRFRRLLRGAYRDKNGTWFVSARYKNWAGETKNETEFSTKREIFAWGQEFIAKNIGKVHYQQHSRHLDESRNRGDQQDMVVDVIHAFFRFSDGCCCKSVFVKQATIS